MNTSENLAQGVALFGCLLRVSIMKTVFGHFREVERMQTQDAIIKGQSHVMQNNPSGGGIESWMTRLFGCRHRKMSRPFSNQGQAYRTCLDCGARRQFNLGRWQMQGGFYYRQPTSTYFRTLNRLAAR
jgi:hypothetical protein